MSIDWETTLSDAAKQLGKKLFVAAKDAAGDSWGDVEEANKEQIELLSTLLAQLKLRELIGEDVADLVRHVESQIADLKFTNKSAGARAIKAFWIEAAKITGSVIFTIAKKAIIPIL